MNEIPPIDNDGFMLVQNKRKRAKQLMPSTSENRLTSVGTTANIQQSQTTTVAPVSSKHSKNTENNASTKNTSKKVRSEMKNSRSEDAIGLDSTAGMKTIAGSSASLNCRVANADDVVCTSDTAVAATAAAAAAATTLPKMRSRAARKSQALSKKGAKDTPSAPALTTLSTVTNTGFVTNLIDCKLWPKLEDDKTSRKKVVNSRQKNNTNEDGLSNVNNEGVKSSKKSKRAAKNGSCAVLANSWTSVITATATAATNEAVAVADVNDESKSNENEMNEQTEADDVVVVVAENAENAENVVCASSETVKNDKSGDKQTAEEVAPVAVESVVAEPTTVVTSSTTTLTTKTTTATTENYAAINGTTKRRSTSMTATATAMTTMASKVSRAQRDPTAFEVYKRDVKFFDNLSNKVNYDDEQVCGQQIATKIGLPDISGNPTQHPVYSIPSRNANIYYSFDGTMKALRVHLCKFIENLFQDGNLRKDIFLKSYVDANDSLPLQILASQRSIQKITNDLNLIISAILLSSVLEIDSDDYRVRRKSTETDSEQSVSSANQTSQSRIGIGGSSYRYCPIPQLQLKDIIVPLSLQQKTKPQPQPLLST